MIMKKLILYFTACLMVVMGISCTDQLRIDERQTTFDVNYFTYSRYQLTTAIVNVAKNYGSASKDARKGQCALYFMDCYSSDQVASFYTRTDQNWDYQGSNAYTNELRTLAAITELATSEGNMANVAAADILKCVIGAYLTEKYGDIPFSEAVQGRTGNLFPKFDTQKEIYESMFKMLDDAVKVLADANSQGLPSNHDVLFAGDKTKWIKFANSLKFRLMVHSYNAFKKAGKDLAADMQAIASSNNYMSTVADNAALGFSGLNEGESWYLQTKWGTGNEFYEQKPTKYLIDQMVALDDPRMYVIFAPVLSPASAKTVYTEETIKINGFDYKIEYYPASQYAPEDLDAAGRDLNGNTITVPYILDSKWFGTPNPLNVHLQYKGVGLPGTHSQYDNRRITGFSTLIAKTNDARLKAVLMESSEMQFLLAEARKNGWISAGTVKDYYEQGIKLSFARWGVVNGTKPATHIGSDNIIDDYNAYCAKAGVVLDGSAADLDKIALQKWFSLLITNQTEAFTDYLRTGKPTFVGKIAPSFSSYTYPQRYNYPLDEASNNKDNYNAAVTALGGKDLPSAKMWILQ
jgi:hypothetical protein